MSLKKIGIPDFLKIKIVRSLLTETLHKVNCGTRLGYTEMYISAKIMRQYYFFAFLCSPDSNVADKIKFYMIHYTMVSLMHYQYDRPENSILGILEQNGVFRKIEVMQKRSVGSTNHV